MNYYISDTHFGHANTIRFDNRPFANPEEMDATLIRNWNERVTDKDDVYFLGDLTYRSVHPAGWYLGQLRGRKHLIIGNHDRQMLMDPESMRFWQTVDKILTITEHYRGNKTKVTLCHYPMVTWPGAGVGGFHIYGHVHCSLPTWLNAAFWPQEALNAGCMITNYSPATLEELIEFDKNFRIAYMCGCFGTDLPADPFG